MNPSEEMDERLMEQLSECSARLEALLAEAEMECLLMTAIITMLDVEPPALE